MNEQQKEPKMAGFYTSLVWLCMYLVFTLIIWGFGVRIIITRDISAGLIPVIVFYISILVMETYNLMKGNEPVVAGTRILPSEVLYQIRKRIQERPFVRWRVICGHYYAYTDASGGAGTAFSEHDSETRDWYFEPNRSWKIETPSGPPSEEIFKKAYTYLTIKVYCLPGVLTKESAYVYGQREFLSSHNGHDKSSILNDPLPTTPECTFFTSKDDQIPYYLRKGSKVCFLFGLFGLSFFFRLFVYCKVGHINYVITKRHDSHVGNKLKKKDVGVRYV